MCVTLFCEVVNDNLITIIVILLFSQCHLNKIRGKFVILLCLCLCAIPKQKAPSLMGWIP